MSECLSSDVCRHSKLREFVMQMMINIVKNFIKQKHTYNLPSILEISEQVWKKVANISQSTIKQSYMIIEYKAPNR